MLHTKHFIKSQIFHVSYQDSILVLLKLDVRKERMKNLVPAKVGVYSFFVFIILFLNHLVNYSLSNSDNGTKCCTMGDCSDQPPPFYFSPLFFQLFSLVNDRFMIVLQKNVEKKYAPICPCILGHFLCPLFKP